MKWFSCPDACRLSLSGPEFTRVVRRMRHAFLNDLQVLSGWLQLGRTASAGEYLSRIQTRLTADSTWATLESPDLQAVLFLAKTEAEDAGLGFSAEVLEAPDPAYVTAAAATLDRTPPAARARPAGWPPDRFAVALLAVLRSVIRSAARRSAADYGSPVEVETTLGFVGGGFEAAVRLRGSNLAARLPGLAEEALVSSGFAPLAGPGRPAVGLAPALVGLGWRAARASRAGDRVSEGDERGMALIVFAGLERADGQDPDGGRDSGNLTHVR